MTHRTAATLVIVGGALMALGSFLPWISARSGLGSIDVAGTDGDGVITLGIGAVVGLIGLVHMDRPMANLLRALVIVASVIALLVVGFDYQAANERIAEIDSEAIAASVGAGLYVTGIGALAAIFGAVRMSAVNEKAPPVWPTAPPTQ